MKTAAKFTFICLFLLVSLLPAPVQAQEDSAGITLAATAGFDSFYKDVHWVPVHITVANSGAAIDGQLRIVTGSPSSNSDLTYLAPISLPTQSSKRLTLYVHLDSFTSRLDVDLLDDRGRVLRNVETAPLERMETDELLYAVVSNEQGDLTYLENVVGSRSRAAVAFVELAALPESAPAWNALDILVLSNVDTGRFTPGQQSALRNWLSTGGQLVVTGGASWQQTVNGVADLLPVAVSGNQSVSDLPRLRLLNSEAFDEDGPYLVTDSSLTQGEVLLQDESSPLLARRAWGRGSVYFLALDPDTPPLQGWDGAENLWDLVARRAEPLPFYATGIKDSYAAQEAVSALPSLTLPSIWGVLCFLSVYILIIGPVNYVILKRLGRRELAWLTIPGLILFFSAATYIVGFSVRGNAAIVNQMSIAYGQLDSDQVRVHGLVGLYSPNRTTYDMAVAENHLLRPFQSTFGAVGGGGALDAIEQNGTITAKEVRLDISGIETFLVDTYSPMPAFSGQAVLRLEEERFYLDIDVQNNSDLEITHAAVLFGNRVEQLGPLAPGERFQDSFRLSSSSVSSVSGGMPMFSPVGPGSSVLSYQVNEIVGSSSPYDDPTTRSWANLLRSLEYPYGATTPGAAPAGVVTLIAWTESSQFEIDLSGRTQENLATTLYFLELPLDQTAMAAADVTLDEALISWEVLENNGTFNPDPFDLDLSNGSVEFEYTPWPEFQQMAVTTLEIRLEREVGDTSIPPDIRIWDWEENEWIDVPGVGWGVNEVPEEGVFLGPNNAVRLRLINHNFSVKYIDAVYPLYNGSLTEDE